MLQQEYRKSLFRLTAVFVLMGAAILWYTQTEQQKLSVSRLDAMRELQSLQSAIESAQLNGTDSSHSFRTAGLSIVDRSSSHLLQWIEQAAVQAGCTLYEYAPIVVDNDDPQRSSVRVLVHGNYFCAGKMIDALEQSRAVVDVATVSIVRLRGSDQLETDIRLNIWFVE